jgi:hypothetical protein
MPKLAVSVPHTLSQDEALHRIKTAVAQARVSGKVENLEENWSANICTFSGSAMGQSASATITVNPSDVAFDVALPFAASLFKSQIASTIRDFTAKLLAK